jgi:hypothetical protein
MGMSCQPIAGYEREMFSAGCTMNIGSKKLLRELASTFCGAQGYFDLETRVLEPLENPSAQKCYPCDRYILLPMSPG